MILARKKCAGTGDDDDPYRLVRRRCRQLLQEDRDQLRGQGISLGGPIEGENSHSVYRSRTDDQFFSHYMDWGSQ